MWILVVIDTSTDTPYPEAERLVTTVSVTSETTNSNSLLPNTASKNSCNYCLNNVQTLGLV
jgi:hypothetical protein